MEPDDQLFWAWERPRNDTLRSGYYHNPSLSTLKNIMRNGPGRDFREFGVETCENMLAHVGTRIRWRLFLVLCYAYVTCMRSRVQKDGLQMQDIAMLGAVVTQAYLLQSSRFSQLTHFHCEFKLFVLSVKCKLCFGISAHHLLYLHNGCFAIEGHGLWPSGHEHSLWRHLLRFVWFCEYRWACQRDRCLPWKWADKRPCLNMEPEHY